MNSAPHLLIEDRPEFERVLDEALRTAYQRAELTGVGQRLSTEQLRTQALRSAQTITACADREYQRFVTLRAELRPPTGTSPSVGTEPRADSARERTKETAGAGFTAIVAVLTPILAGVAGALLLLVGYLLRMMDPEPALAEPLRTAGWSFAALAAAGLLIGGVGLMVTAVRNSSHSGGSDSGLAEGQAEGQAERVATARAEWRKALLERGIVPFLHAALAEETTARHSPSSPRPAEGGRTPQLGYSRPGFTSPAPRGPERTSSQPRFSSPDYGSPDYDSPDFGSPDDVPH